MPMKSPVDLKYNLINTATFWRSQKSTKLIDITLNQFSKPQLSSRRTRKRYGRKVWLALSISLSASRNPLNFP